MIFAMIAILAFTKNIFHFIKAHNIFLFFSNQNLTCSYWFLHYQKDC